MANATSTLNTIPVKSVSADTNRRPPIRPQRITLNGQEYVLMPVDMVAQEAPAVAPVPSTYEITFAPRYVVPRAANDILTALAAGAYYSAKSLADARAYAKAKVLLGDSTAWVIDIRGAETPAMGKPVCVATPAKTGRGIRCRWTTLGGRYA